MPIRGELIVIVSQMSPVTTTTRLLRMAACMWVCIPLSACPSTKVDRVGEAPAATICQTQAAPLSALVLWTPQWRADQKDVNDREAAAARGIDRYFKDAGCFARAEIRRLQADESLAGRTSGDASSAGVAAIEPVDQRIGATAAAMAANDTPRPDRTVVVVVHELGPVVRIGSPALLEGGTEVVLHVTVLNTAAGRVLMDQRTHWQHGGAFYIKGVASLEHDMYAALQASLQPNE